jgi:hypothetical protein
MQSPPSIPSHESVFGYEEGNGGMLVKQNNPETVHKGEKGDTIGPGQYNIPGVFNADKKKAKGLSWQRSKSKREIHNTKDKADVDFMTPRDYNIFPIYKFKNSSVFASKVPKMHTQKQKMKYGKRASLSAPKQPNALDDLNNDSDDEGAPGPGFYYNPSTISDFTIEPYTGKNQFFGSTVERFQPPKVHFYEIYRV